MLKNIFDNGNIRAVHYTPKENNFPGKLVITFQPIIGRLSNKGFGTSFFEKEGIEYIFLSHKGRSFYQEMSIQQFHDIVINYIEGKEVFLYGSSLGAYAAIYYSGVVNGQAIALSPRCTADPIYGEKREEIEFKHIPISDLDKKNISSFNPIIAYDPYVVQDEIFMNKRILKVYKDSKVLKINNGSHPVGKVMNNSKVLKDFVLGAIKYRSLVVKKEIDLLTLPAHTFKIAKYCLAKNKVDEFNKNLFYCLKWGGHRKLLPLIKKSISEGKLKFRISEKEISQSSKMLNINRDCLNLDLYKSNSVIKIMFDNLDYSAALFLIELKLSSFPDEELINIKRELLKEKQFMESLPTYEKYNSNII